MSRETTSFGAVPVLASIAALAETSDGWICDIWGVLHNGLEAFPAAPDACRKFRAQGGTIVLVSNAPRPGPVIARQLLGYGIDGACYDAIVTSGDVTRTMLEAWQRRPLLHIGPERDMPTFEGLDITFADADAAEVVGLTGLYDDTTETPGDYADLFERLLARRVPVICANPDLVVERGSEVIYCAGALAQLYENLGGDVAYAGKPHLPVYRRALGEIDRMRRGATAKERVLAIGDGLRTDMDGAHAAGLRAVFVASAIHVEGNRPLDPATVEKLFSERSYRPVAALDALVW